MFFFKKKENLFVDILDLKVDCSEIINIKEAKLVYVNGKGKLTVETGKSEPPNWEAPAKIKLMVSHWYKLKFLIVLLVLLYLQQVMV